MKRKIEDTNRSSIMITLVHQLQILRDEVDRNVKEGWSVARQDRGFHGSSVTGEASEYENLKERSQGAEAGGGKGFHR